MAELISFNQMAFLCNLGITDLREISRTDSSFPKLIKRVGYDYFYDYSAFLTWHKAHPVRGLDRVLVQQFLTRQVQYET